MLIIMGTVRIDPARLDAARPAITAVVTATRGEAGCLHYAYAQDLLDPGLFHISERWESREALKGHFASAHMAEWRAAIPGLGVTDRDLSLYEVSGTEPI